MSRVDMLIAQHQDILAVAKKIAKHLQKDILQEQAEEVRSLLSTFSAKLKMHLQLEDRIFYPTLMSAQDAYVRNAAQRFLDEMGTLGDTFVAYSKKWDSVEIRKKPEAFIAETKGVFEALERRIGREEKSLYPLTANLPKAA